MRVDVHYEWHENTGTRAWVPSVPVCPWDCGSDTIVDEVAEYRLKFPRRLTGLAERLRKVLR